MHADWSVELGADDPVLDFPWPSPSGDEISGETLRFYDLKSDPELIDRLPEARTSAELRKFLLRVNARGFPLLSAKCDHWFSEEISEEEEIFGAPCKYGSYVDILFTDHEGQKSFPDHEEFVVRVCSLLKRGPEMPAQIELIVRRCFYQSDSQAESPPESGYYFTAYVSGFGETEVQSRQQWGIALTLLQHGLVQSAKR